MAKSYEEGEGIFQSDTKALEMCIRAAELGSAQAFGLIGNNYKDGIAVETNASKAIEFYDLAAKKGSITGHQVLAEIHKFSGNNHKHIKHLTVAASARVSSFNGHVNGCLQTRITTKRGSEITLRAFQASINEMKSKDRDDARLFEEMFRHRGRE